jgi:hypothetical protein
MAAHDHFLSNTSESLADARADFSTAPPRIMLLAQQKSRLIGRAVARVIFHNTLFIIA